DTLPLPDALPSLETLPLGRVPVLGPQRFQSGHCVGHPLQEFTNRVLGGRGGRLGAAVGVVAVWAGRRAVAGTTVTAGLLGGRLGAALGRRQLCCADDDDVVDHSVGLLPLIRPPQHSSQLRRLGISEPTGSIRATQTYNDTVTAQKLWRNFRG